MAIFWLSVIIMLFFLACIVFGLAASNVSGSVWFYIPPTGHVGPLAAYGAVYLQDVVETARGRTGPYQPIVVDGCRKAWELWQESLRPPGDSQELNYLRCCLPFRAICGV